MIVTSGASMADIGCSFRLGARGCDKNAGRADRRGLGRRTVALGGGLRFRKDLLVRAGGVKVHPDIVFMKARVAVFVDGCFWHGCPEHQVAPRSNRDYWVPTVRIGVVGRGQQHTRVDDEHDQSGPNPSASISSASRAERPEVDEPIPTNAGRRGATSGNLTGRCSASWEMSSTTVMPRRPASASRRTFTSVGSSTVVDMRSNVRRQHRPSGRFHHGVCRTTGVRHPHWHPSPARRLVGEPPERSEPKGRKGFRSGRGGTRTPDSLLVREVL